MLSSSLFVTLLTGIGKLHRVREHCWRAIERRHSPRRTNAYPESALQSTQSYPMESQRGQGKGSNTAKGIFYC